MSWTNFFALSVDKACPKPIREKATELAGYVEHINRQREELNQRRKEFQEADPNEPIDLFISRDYAQTEIELLRAEATTRRQLATLDDEYHAALSDLQSKAFDQVEAAKIDILKKLVEIGYHEGEPHTPDPCRIQPGWILAHPQVHSANSRFRELQGKSVDRSFAKQNTEALQEVEQRLAAIREKLSVA